MDSIKPIVFLAFVIALCAVGTFALLMFGDVALLIVVLGCGSAFLFFMPILEAILYFVLEAGKPVAWVFRKVFRRKKCTT